MYLGLHPFTECGHCLGTDAVQSGRHLVGVLVEFRSSANGSQHDFQGRPLGLRVFFHRDATAVVADAQAAVHVDLHMDMFGVAGERFIDAVVNQFID